MRYFVLLFVGIGIWTFAYSPVSAAAPLQQLIDDTPINGILTLEEEKYDGNIKINKPITIIGKGNTVIRGDGEGNVVTIDASNVTLKNLTIEHGSLSRSSDEEFSGIRARGDYHQFVNIVIHDVYHGLFLNKANHAKVKNVSVTGQGTGKLGSQGNGIQLIRSSDITIEDSFITQSRDGIFFEFADRVEVKDTFVSRTRYGLHYMYSNNNKFINNRFIKNTGGAAIMHSQGIILEGNQFSFNQGSRSFGLIIQTSEDNIIKNNEFYLNQRGIYLEQSNQNQIIGNKFFHNDIGIELWSSSSNQTFTGNHFKQNVAHVLAVGGEATNHWYHNDRGNYWGNERSGFDLDQNGIGDSPIEYKSSLYKLVDENELAYLFLKSPSIGIYEKINEVMNTQDVMVKDQFPLIEKQKRQSPSWLLPILFSIPILLIGMYQFYKFRRSR
ncbi:nitrous oxide reductase family maturation protein NosD [Cytobacillus massiliigabonensis]|uniref:nitrous oxide reductase family maturation protein NosD n=1 Tax=Cytobacillus massiliigabonensis TaxID=1871011 RepID=UPI000C818AE5|nr:nitrous oxide reductase family maturation protein NosD [Cytobacillus massiliigabonensis]